MTESRGFPTRLLRQPSSILERALLNAGTEVKASDATRVAVLEALGLEHSHLALVKPRPMPWRRGAFLLAAMVVSAAAVAVPLTRRNMASGVVPPIAGKDVSADGAPGATRAHRARTEAINPPHAESSETKATVTKDLPPRVAEEASVARNAVPASGRNVLAAELLALDAARARLNSGDPRAALGLLESYQRDFPKPRLALEAEVLRIDALDRAGQSDLARRRAEAFVQNHPKGVLTGRVRRYLEK